MYVCVYVYVCTCPLYLSTTCLGHDDADVGEPQEEEGLLPALRAQGGGVHACVDIILMYIYYIIFGGVDRQLKERRREEGCTPG